MQLYSLFLLEDMRLHSLSLRETNLIARDAIVLSLSTWGYAIALSLSQRDNSNRTKCNRTLSLYLYSLFLIVRHAIVRQCGATEVTRKQHFISVAAHMYIRVPTYTYVYIFIYIPVTRRHGGSPQWRFCEYYCLDIYTYPHIIICV